MSAEEITFVRKFNSVNRLGLMILQSAIAARTIQLTGSPKVAVHQSFALRVFKSRYRSEYLEGMLGKDPFRILT